MGDILYERCIFQKNSIHYFSTLDFSVQICHNVVELQFLGGFVMNHLKQLPEKSFLKLFFFLFSFSFVLAAFFMPDRQDMLPGLLRILQNPTLASTNAFSIGGYAATFLNMGLLGLICSALYCIPGTTPAGPSVLAVILTVGFGSWGIHVLNVWPTMLGVVLYCIVRKKPLGNYTHLMLLTTGLAPFISEILVRYPYDQVVPITPARILLALAIGIAAGFTIPAGIKNAPTVHRGLTVYSAALPVGMAAFLMYSVLYKVMGVPVPGAVSDLHVASAGIVNTFCCILFGLCVLGALLLGCRPRDYWKLMIDPEVVTNFSTTYGNAVMLMNVGMFGFFILGYYNLIGAEFNGVTFGVIFCMLCTCNAGSHPLNVLPIMLGYALITWLFQLVAPFAHGNFTLYLNAQAIIVGLCYANGLSLLSDKYGWFWGMLSAILHYCMVTTTPLVHGSMCLYNGGFTTGLVCLLLMPTLEKIVDPKLVRRALRKERADS